MRLPRTFFLGNNWDYRLTFLLLAVPQLLRWYRPPSTLRRAALLNLVCVALAFYWYFYSSENLLRFILVKQAIDWLIAAGVAYLLLLTLPRWLKELLMLRRRGGRAVAA